jgi:hypothetical protein
VSKDLATELEDELVKGKVSLKHQDISMRAQRYSQSSCVLYSQTTAYLSFHLVVQVLLLEVLQGEVGSVVVQVQWEEHVLS